MGMLNWSSAFSEAGKAIGVMGIEGVKASLEQDKIKLADELAGKREDIRAGREDTRQERLFAHSDASQERGFTHAENLQGAALDSSEYIHARSEEGADRRSSAQIASSEKIHKEAIASSERIAKASNAIAGGQLSLAQARDKIDNDLKQD